MKLNDIFIAVFITLIWGLNFSVIKIGLNTVDPFVLAGIRFTLCAFPAIFFIKKPNVSFAFIVGYGFLFGIGLWGAVNLSIHVGLSAGIASLVLQISAFFTLLLGSLIYKENISGYKIVGMLLALGGLACIISITDGTVNVSGLTLVIMAALSWSFANLIIKKSAIKEIFSFLVWSSLFSPIPLFIIAYLLHGTTPYENIFLAINEKAIFSILFQVYPTTLFGYWVWNSLLRKYPISTVAPLSLLVPVFGILGSVLIFHEHLGYMKILATSLIILGLAVGLYVPKVKVLSMEKC